MFSLRPSTPPVVGLDISSTAVKLLQFSRSNGRYRVEHYASEPLPANAITEKKIVEVEAVGEAIRRAVQRSGSKARHAAVAVAGSAVITKVIPMPADLTEDELETQIELEANQYIPYPLEEVNLDFEVLGPAEGNPNLINVLLAASRAENVDVRVAAVELGGLVAQCVDVEAFAMENALTLLDAGSEPPETRGVVDIGGTMTTLNVVRRGRNIYTREQVFGGKQLTEEIVRRYDLSFQEADLAKRQGGLPESYELDILEPFKEQLVQQVSRALKFFFGSSELNEVDQIVLAGGCSSIEGVADMVEERLEFPTIVANPFAHMSVASRVQPALLERDSPTLMISSGLALRSFG